MSNDQNWQSKLDQLGSHEEQQLLQRLRTEDPDLADAMWAKMVENNLDDIGVEKVSAPMHERLYAITESTRPKKSMPIPIQMQKWGAWIGVAAVLMVTIVLKPWQDPQPSAEEIAQARQQLSVAFQYLDKAANIARQETEASIALGVKTAMDSSPFIDVEAEEDNSINL